MFESVNILRQRLSSNNAIEVVHGGYFWTAAFQWEPPATSQEVEVVQHDLPKSIPADYLAFLSTTANGATLFYDFKNGQWGYKIYGTKELVERQEYWTKFHLHNLSSNLLVFGETIGDSHILAFNLECPSKDGRSFCLMEGNVYTPIQDWPILSRSFHEWLDHLITAQGDKYWEWR